MSDEAQKNIYQRINAVMQAVKYVKKDKSVSGGGQNYKAVTHDQVVSECRKHLVENGIAIIPEQLTGKLLIERDLSRDIKMHLYSGEYAVHFVNIDSPEDRVTITVQAHAADNGDKAPGKAYTYATKMAILKALSLETGEDDESRTAEPEVDVGDWIEAINTAETMEALQQAFTEAYNDCKKHKEAVRQITIAKDAKKKALSEAGNE